MKLLIGGADKTSLLRSKSLRIQDGINERSVCSFLLIDVNGIYHADVGEPVEVRDDSNNLVFAGTVDEPEEAQPLGTSVLDLAVQVVDWHQIADRRIVAETYENQAAGTIVNDIITKYLADEGITAGTVQNGPTIKRAVFNYYPASQCLDELSELTGYQWRINPDKSLDFFDRTTNAAPWNITPDNTPIRNVRVRRNRENYRNRQHVRAGRDISVLQTREFAGDGKTKVWTVDLPIALEPTIKLNGAAKTVGIRGLETGFDFYWQKGEKEISQDNGAAALTSSDTLTIEYQGFYPIIVTADSPEAISDRQTVEGGSGLYEHVEQRTDIDKQEAALEYAQGLLRRYARVGPVVYYDTFEPGLKPGQLQSINLPQHNIDDNFLISRVTTSDIGATDGTLLYSIEALSGEAVGGWTTFFKKLMQKQKTFVIRENEILIKLLTFRESFSAPTMEDEMTYTLHQYHICGQTTCGTDVIL